MLITSSLVQKLAKLAKLPLTPQQEERFPKQLNEVFTMFESLKKIDTSNVELVNFNETNRTREDKVIEFENKKELLNNSVEKKNGYIKVNSVLGKAT